jgi:hypothetical protein
MQHEKSVQENEHPKDIEKRFTRGELIEQLESTINYFHRLPRHEQFSFVTNADLYHLMVLVLNILKLKEGV